MGELLIHSQAMGIPAELAYSRSDLELEIERVGNKLIAAHALALGVTLVTNNPVDFQAYPELQIANWVGVEPQPQAAVRA